MSEAHTPSSESPLAVAAAAVLEMPSTFVEDMNTHIDAGEVVALLIEAFGCCILARASRRRSTEGWSMGWAPCKHAKKEETQREAADGGRTFVINRVIE